MKNIIKNILEVGIGIIILTMIVTLLSTHFIFPIIFDILILLLYKKVIKNNYKMVKYILLIFTLFLVLLSLHKIYYLLLFCINIFILYFTDFNKNIISLLKSKHRLSVNDSSFFIYSIKVLLVVNLCSLLYYTQNNINNFFTVRFLEIFITTFIIEIIFIIFILLFSNTESIEI